MKEDEKKQENKEEKNSNTKKIFKKSKTFVFYFPFQNQLFNDLQSVNIFIKVLNVIAFNFSLFSSNKSARTDLKRIQNSKSFYQF